MKRLIEKLKDWAVTIAIFAVVGGGLFALYYFNYYVWRLKHPDAPFWTYFFSN